MAGANPWRGWQGDTGEPFRVRLRDDNTGQFPDLTAYPVFFSMASAVAGHPLTPFSAEAAWDPEGWAVYEWEDADVAYEGVFRAAMTVMGPEGPITWPSQGYFDVILQKRPAPLP